MLWNLTIFFIMKVYITVMSLEMGDLFLDSLLGMVRPLWSYLIVHCRKYVFSFISRTWCSTKKVKLVQRCFWERCQFYKTRPLISRTPCQLRPASNWICFLHSVKPNVISKFETVSGTNITYLQMMGRGGGDWVHSAEVLKVVYRYLDDFLVIFTGVIRSQEREIEELKAKLAQVLAVMPGASDFLTSGQHTSLVSYCLLF